MKEEVLDYVKSHGATSTNNAFKNVFLSYLTDAGETLVADCTIIDYKKDGERMRLDGYAFSEYFHSLTLLISHYDSKNQPSKIGKTEVEKQSKKALKFFKACNSDFFDDLEESSDGYQAYEYITQHRAEIETVNIVFITNAEASVSIPENTKYGSVQIKYDVWDIERLYNCVFSDVNIDRQITIKLEKKYKTPIILIRVPESNPTYDCYIGVISGELLAQIYRDEGQDLIQKNVRSFLQATGKVNKGIKNSLANEPHMFMAYNNGISTIADEIKVKENESDSNIVTITEISGWQIVNGGQTTASIYNAYQNKLPLSKVSVQIKLTVIKEKEQADTIIHNISQYANSQNKINMSDFNANDPYHVKMERISRSTFIPVEKGKETDLWFYERARGQYLVELNRQPTPAAKKQFKERCPKSRCISKTVAAKCVMAYIGFPDIVSKGLESNFVFFSEKIKNQEFPEPSRESYITMISQVILFRDVDKIVYNMRFGGFKAQQNYYIVALIGKYYAHMIDPKIIWENQRISDKTVELVQNLANFVWNHFQNPTTPGVNIGQWCKKEECWKLLQERFESSDFQVEE